MGEASKDIAVYDITFPFHNDLLLSSTLVNGWCLK